MQLRRTVFLALLLAQGEALGAQPSKRDLTALKLTSELCLLAVTEGKTSVAVRFADEGERAYRTILATDSLEVRARVGLARLLGECRSPLLAQAAVLDVYYEGIRLLNEALRIDSSDFAARYTLAQFYFNGPTKHHSDAVRELETLVRRHGHRGDILEMASTFLMLGDLYFREGRSEDAVGVWRRGQQVFEADLRFRYRINANP